MRNLREGIGEKEWEGRNWREGIGEGIGRVDQPLSVLRIQR